MTRFTIWAALAAAMLLAETSAAQAYYPRPVPRVVYRPLAPRVVVRPPLYGPRVYAPRHYGFYGPRVYPMPAYRAWGPGLYGPGVGFGFF